MGAARSEVGRQWGEAEAEAMKECENERVSGFNQSSGQQIISLCVVVIFYFFYLFPASTAARCESPELSFSNIRLIEMR